jgi:chaperonin GroES
VIPDSATEKPVKGQVIAVGEGKIAGQRQVRAIKVKAGDKVLFGKYSGHRGQGRRRRTTS